MIKIFKNIQNLNNISVQIFNHAKQVVEKDPRIDKKDSEQFLSAVVKHFGDLLYIAVQESGLDLSDPKIVSNYKDKIFKWNPGQIGPEESYALTVTQLHLGDRDGIFDRLHHEQLAERKLREILQKLNGALLEGVKILNEKIKKLESQKLSSKTTEKIQLMKDAIGPSELAIFFRPNPATINQLSANIQNILHDQKPISAVQVNNIQTHFTQIVSTKIMEPLKNFHDERPFLTKVREWFTDTTKKIFGRENLSTKSHLSGLAKSLTTIFNIGKRKANEVFNQVEERNAKKVR